MANNTLNFQQVENSFQAVEQYYQQKFYEANQNRYRGQLSAVVDWFHQVKTHVSTLDIQAQHQRTEIEAMRNERAAVAIELNRVQQQLQEVQNEYSQTVTSTTQLEVQCQSLQKALADQSSQTAVVSEALRQILHYPRGTRSELVATLSHHGVSSPTAEAIIDGGAIAECTVHTDWSPGVGEEGRSRRKSTRPKRTKIEDLIS